MWGFNRELLKQELKRSNQYERDFQTKFDINLTYKGIGYKPPPDQTFSNLNLPNNYLNKVQVKEDVFEQQLILQPNPDQYDKIQPDQYNLPDTKKKEMFQEKPLEQLPEYEQLKKLKEPQPFIPERITCLDGPEQKYFRSQSFNDYRPNSVQPQIPEIQPMILQEFRSARRSHHSSDLDSHSPIRIDDDPVEIQPSRISEENHNLVQILNNPKQGQVENMLENEMAESGLTPIPFDI